MTSPPFWQIASKQMFHKLHWLLEQRMISLAHKLLNRFTQMFHRSSVKLFGIWWCFMRSVLWIHWGSFRVLNLKSQVWKLEIPSNHHILRKKKVFTSSSQVSVVTTIGVTGGLKTRKGIMKQSLVTFLSSARPSEIMPFFDWLQIFKRFYLYKHSRVSLVQQAFLQVLKYHKLTPRCFHQNRSVSTPLTKLRKGRRWHQTHPKRHSCGSTDWGQEWQNPTSESHVSSSTGRYHGCVGIEISWNKLLTCKNLPTF